MPRLALTFAALSAAAFGARFVVSLRDPGVAQTQTPSQLASIQVLTDRLTPVSGAAVRLSNAGAERVIVADTHGQTPWVPVDVGSSVTLTLIEAVHDQGVLVGMIETLPPFAWPSGQDAYLLEVSRTQPLAVPMVIRGAPNASTTIEAADGVHQHWCILVEANATLRFPANVASLLDAESIRQYLRYRGDHARVAVDYVRGATMIVPHVDMGSNGFFVGVDLLGDLPNGVTVDVVNYATGQAAGPSLQVQPVGVIDSTVFVKVTGELQAGHLAVLARPLNDKAPAVTAVVQDDPPKIRVPANGGGGVDSVKRADCIDCGRDDVASTAGERGQRPDGGSAASVVAPSVSRSSTLASRAVVTDCEPPVPVQPTGWECECAAPGSTDCPAVPGPKDCKDIRMRGPRVCKPARVDSVSLGARRTRGESPSSSRLESARRWRPAADSSTESRAMPSSRRSGPLARESTVWVSAHVSSGSLTPVASGSRCTPLRGLLTSMDTCGSSRARLRRASSRRASTSPSRRRCAIARPDSQRSRRDS